jgi:hypothetical protein
MVCEANVFVPFVGDYFIKVEMYEHVSVYIFVLYINYLHVVFIGFKRVTSPMYYDCYIFIPA